MWAVFSFVCLDFRLGWLLQGQGVPFTTRNWAQTSVTTAPCLYRWAPPREPTRAARTLAWGGRSVTPSTVQKLERLKTVKTEQASPATTSKTTKMRVIKVTRKKSRCTQTTEQITRRKKGGSWGRERGCIKEGSSARKPQGRQFIFYIHRMLHRFFGGVISFLVLYKIVFLPLFVQKTRLHISWWTVFLWSYI